MREAVAKIPEGRRKVISTHNAFGYFAAAYGVEFIAPLGVSDRIRGQRPRYRGDHHPDQGRRKFRRFFWKISAIRA